MPWCVGCTFRWHCRVPLPSLNPNNIKCMTMASWVLRTLRLVKTTMNAGEGWVEVSSSSEIQTSTRRYCGLNFKDIIKLVTVFETVTTNSVHTGRGRCCRSVLYLAHLPASSYYSHPRNESTTWPCRHLCPLSYPSGGIWDNWCHKSFPAMTSRTLNNFTIYCPSTRVRVQ